MKTICILLLIGLNIFVFADMPGNKARPSYDVYFYGLQDNKDYEFYSNMSYDDSASTLKDSASIHLPGGFGAPPQAFVWAINKKTKISTDTLYFSGGAYDYDLFFRLSIEDNHLLKTQLDNINAREENQVDPKESNSLSDEQVQEDNMKWRNITSTFVIFASIAFTVLVYIYYKRKKI